MGKSWICCAAVGRWPIVLRRRDRAVAVAFLAVIFLFLSAEPAFPRSTGKTPNDVYAMVMLLKSEVISLRARYGIKEKLPAVPVQTGNAPRHVLQKAIEVLDKVNRLRRIKKMGAITIPPYPSRSITPNEVYDIVERLYGEVHLFLPEEKLRQAKKTTGETPNDVYRQLWIISKAFDPILGIKGLMPADVYNKSVEVLRTVKFLRLTQNLTEQGVRLPDRTSGNHPNHSLKAVYKLLDKIGTAEKNLWIEPVKRRKVPERVIEPQEVYDALNIVVAELQRIKYRIGVERHIPIPRFRGDKIPDDVVLTIETAITLMPDFSKKPLIQYDPAFLKKTPNEVYAVAEHILAELRRYKTYRGIKKPVRKAALPSGIQPKHVYQKTLENIEKVSRLRKQLGIGSMLTPEHPLRPITPTEVYELAIRLDSEMELIYKISGVRSSTPYYEMVNHNIPTGKTPSDVFVSAKLITDKLFLIGKRLGKVSKLPAVPKAIEKRPADVLEAIVRLNKLIQKAKKHSGIYGRYRPLAGFTGSGEDVRPDDVYNAVGIIIADIEELNVHLGITTHTVKTARAEGKTPSDVYQQIETAKNLLLRILR